MHVYTKMAYRSTEVSLIWSIFYVILVGILGALFFAICALPQVIKAVKTKSTKDISYFYIYFSILGNIFSAIYIFYTNYTNGFWQYPQYFNYGTALLLIIVLLVLKLKYDNNDDTETQKEAIMQNENEIVYDYEPDTVADALAWVNKKAEELEEETKKEAENAQQWYNYFDRKWIQWNENNRRRNYLLQK